MYIFRVNQSLPLKKISLRLTATATITTTTTTKEQQQKKQEESNANNKRSFHSFAQNFERN